MLHIWEHIEFRINGKLHGLHSIALLTYPKWLQNSLLPWYVLFNFSFLLFTQSVSPFRLNFVYLVFLEWLPSASRNFFDSFFIALNMSQFQNTKEIKFLFAFTIWFSLWTVGRFHWHGQFLIDWENWRLKRVRKSIELLDFFFKLGLK